MGIFLVAVSLVLAGALLAYGEEISVLVRGPGVLVDPMDPAGADQPAPAGSGSESPTPTPTHLLDSLVRDLESPDARRRDRALVSLPNYPPRVLAQRLVPRLAGPASEAKDRIADLLLRHGGEDVLEPLHRYFLGRVASLEVAEPSEDPPGRRRAPDRVAPNPAMGRIVAFPGTGTGMGTARSRTPHPVGSVGEGSPRPRSGSAPVRLAAVPLPPPLPVELAPGSVPFDPAVLDPDPPLRARAMAMLPASGHPHCFELLTRSLSGDPEPIVRAASAVALADLGVACADVLTLCEATRDQDVSVRWNACYALGRLGRIEAKVALRRAENDGDGSVRLAARKALEALGLDPPFVALRPESETRGA